MKSTLRLKFIMLYIIFGFLSIFTVSLLSNQLLLNKLEQGFLTKYVPDCKSDCDLLPALILFK